MSFHDCDHAADAGTFCPTTDLQARIARNLELIHQQNSIRQAEFERWRRVWQTQLALHSALIARLTDPPKSPPIRLSLVDSPT